MAPTQAELDANPDLERRMSLVRKFGAQSIGYSSFQEGYSYFDLEDLGYLSFFNCGGTQVSIGDPICTSSDISAVVNGFVNKYPDPCFEYFTERTKGAIEDAGFYVNQFGFDLLINIQRYGLFTKKKQNLRTALSRAKREGITCIEDSSMESNHNVRGISEEWIKTRVVNYGEIRGIVRPMKETGEVDVRKFFAYKGNECQAFIYCDPIYDKEQTIGYLVNIIRQKNDSMPGINDFLVLSALEKFRAEGKKILSLGLMPFYGIKDSGPNFSRPTNLAFRGFFNYGNLLYNFKELAFHKRRYFTDKDIEEGSCTLEKVYFGTKHMLPVRHIYASFLANGVDPMKQTGLAIRKLL